MVRRTFFGKLQRIVHLKVPASQELHLDEPEDVLLALVRTCDAEQDEYGYWKYSDSGSLGFVDLTTIKHVIGRVYDQDEWYIIDRTGQN